MLPHVLKKSTKRQHPSYFANDKISAELRQLIPLACGKRCVREPDLAPGCAHARELSNTWLLETACSWRGVGIDPFASGEWAAERPRTTLFTVAVALGANEEEIAFVAPGHVRGTGCRMTR